MVLTFILIGTICVIWLALVLAPYMNNGLISFLSQISEVDYFNITFSNNSIKIVFLFLLVYFLCITYYLSTRKNYRRKVEYGSAKWGNIKNINRKYKQSPVSNNLILTSQVRFSLNGMKHRRNLNVLVIGGSGAGKTRFYCKPNIMQCNSSYIILDPKGELIRSLGSLLEEKGYSVKVLDLINMDKSNGYNPFSYFQTDNDIQRLVTSYFKATTPKNSTSNDIFWDTAAQMLFSALIYYLWYEAPAEEQNFDMVMEMLRAGEVKEDDDYYLSPLDILFNQLEARDSEHIAVKYYKNYRSGSAKTLKSIQITLASRLEKFNIPEFAFLTMFDELNLTSIGERKTALFAIIPDNDTSFNFLISILYTQLFQQLFFLADNKYHGSLPINVHFVMDEFANVSLPDDFDKILSVMRSRNVSVSIILQNLSQLKSLFEKQWESIVGNCDTFLYLGGNEQSTHKYVSELLGKETIDFDNHSKSLGQSSSYSTNYQATGRELLTPEEVRMLNNDKAVLFIRGEAPIIDSKYDITKHPNYKNIADSNKKIYEYGNSDRAIATISIDTSDNSSNLETLKVSENSDYYLISSEELEDFFMKGMM